MKSDVQKHIFKGLRSDISPDKASNEYYCDALNITLTLAEDGKLLAVSNLAENKRLDLGEDCEDVKGRIIGECRSGDDMVFFTDDGSSQYIYSVSFDVANHTYSPKKVYKDSLRKLIHEYVKDCISSYENEKVRKVYWTDGYSQPKVVNIASEYDDDNNDIFDFVRNVDNGESVTISKNESGGMFHAGTLQYMFTYFNMYGQESKIFHQSPIMYTSSGGIAVETNAKSSNSFSINIDNADVDGWEYIRIYALHRTSTDTAPYARIVTEIPIDGVSRTMTSSHQEYMFTENDVDIRSMSAGGYIVGIQLPSSSLCSVKYKFTRNYAYLKGSETSSRSVKISKPSSYTGDVYMYKLSGSDYWTISASDPDSIPLSTAVNLTLERKTIGRISYTDNGIGGESIDPDILMYVGGNDITVQTMSQKDMTLFVGNIRLNTKMIPSSVKSIMRTKSILQTDVARIPLLSSLASGEYYKYTPQLDIGSSSGYMTKKSRSHFKSGETYRFGVQFMDRLGQWSQPVFICDSRITRKPKMYDAYYDVCRPSFSFRIDDNSTQDEKDAMNDLSGYIKARPVIVFPKEYEREVICQGVINPTVFNVEDRFNNAPFAQASWFFRPNAEAGYYEMSSGQYSSDISPYSERNKSLGSTIPFQHCDELKGANSYRSEIQISRGDIRTTEYNTEQDEYWNYRTLPFVEDGDDVDSNIQAFVSGEARNNYYVDQSIVTLNSPDIDFNDGLLNEDLSSASFRIVGIIGIDAVCGDINITAEGATKNQNGGFFHKSLKINRFNDSISGDASTLRRSSRNILSNGLFWFDSPRFDKSESSSIEYDNDEYKTEINRGWVVYPFQKVGGLSNTSESATIKTKVISNLRFSSKTIYFNSEVKMPVKSSAIFNSLASKSISIGGKNYFGDSDKLLSSNIDIYRYCSHGFGSDTMQGGRPQSKDEMFGSPHDGGASLDYSPRYYKWNGTSTGSLISYSVPAEKYSSGPRINYWSDYGAILGAVYSHIGGVYQSDNQYTAEDIDRRKETGAVVPITYRSSPHAVISLGKNASGVQVVMPTVNNINGIIPMENKVPFWDKTTHSFSQGNITEDGISGNLLIGELVRTISNKFGGTSEYALTNNVWCVAGEAVPIAEDGFTIYYDEGDTYFQRYDCLKTMPLHNDDINQIVEILSFMCETRINIDGRYDKNRGLESNIYVDDSNFNLINTAYTQSDNFFEYGILDKRYDAYSYPAEVAWSSAKVLGAKTDAWTSISMASVLNLDGDKGEITSIDRMSNDLYAFQKNGIAQIMYNQNVQISSEKGLPIELANSGKVDGYRYLSESVGATCSRFGACRSVVGTPAGLYFYDSESNSIYVLGNEGLRSVSSNSMTKSFMDSIHDISFMYDSVLSNVYVYDYDSFKSYDGKDQKYLVYNEGLGEFVTFLDGTDIMHSSCGMPIASRYDVSAKKSYIEEAFGGDKYLDSYIEFVENKNPEQNKVFTNLEMRTNVYSYGRPVIDKTFTDMDIDSEYQRISTPITNINDDYFDGSSNISRKFRTWRMQIGVNNVLGQCFQNERVIGTWCKIRLRHVQNRGFGNEKLTLYDAVTKFFYR